MSKNPTVAATSGLGKNFIKSSELMQISEFNYVPTESSSRIHSTNIQSIFPTPLEHSFYSLLTHNVSKLTFRFVISQILFSEIKYITNAQVLSIFILFV